MLRRAFACALTLTSACTLDFDMVGPHGGGPLGASSTGGGDAAGSAEGGGPINDCSDGGGECVALPEGFQGAVLLGVGCSGAAKVFEGHESFQFAPATCGCSCVPKPSTCALPGLAKAYTEMLCNQNGGAADVSVTDDCVELSTVPDALSIKLAGPGTAPICESDDGAPTIPPIEWITPVEGCSFHSLGCGSDICLPGAGQRYCFYREVGDAPLSCPEGLVDTRVLRETDVGDSRDCQCTCGPKDFDGCALPQWSLFSDASCTTIFGSVQSDCGDAGGEIGSARVTIDSLVSCTQSAVPTGAVSVVPTIQACCSPP